MFFLRLEALPECLWLGVVIGFGLVEVSFFLTFSLAIFVVCLFVCLCLFVLEIMFLKNRKPIVNMRG